MATPPAFVLALGDNFYEKGVASVDVDLEAGTATVTPAADQDQSDAAALGQAAVDAVLSAGFEAALAE